MTAHKIIERRKFNAEIAKFTPRQLAAVKAIESEKKYVLYGGALGGGKSYFLRWYCVRYLMRAFSKFGVKHVTVMLACEDYPSLKDRQLQKIGREIPGWIGRMHGDHKEYGRCFILSPEYGSGVICFRNLDDTSKYQSAEFALIAVDELTKNDYNTFTFLRSRLRFPGIPDSECKFVAATNPGGIGHGWVKQFWMDKTLPEEWRSPIDFSGLFEYIPSKADDNPHLDAAYWAQLQTLPENLRKAFRDGDWNIFIGQAFPEFSTARHVIRPFEVPAYAPVYMTYDWGYGKPFSIGWWFVDADNRLYRFAEWYGWSGTTDQGLRLADSDVARGIIERELALGISGRSITRLCDPTCFNKKPNYMGGGQGPSTAEELAKQGLYLSPGDPSRRLKIAQFRERLRVSDDAMPMMMVFDTCHHFIRTIPNLIMDKNNAEDVDTDGEDHVYDEACHVCMARPISLVKPPSKKTDAEKRIDALERGEVDDEERFLYETEKQIYRQDRLESIYDEYDAYDRLGY